MMNLNNLKQKGNSFFKNLTMLIALAGSIAAFSQDAAVVPANNDTKVIWQNGAAFTGTVSATAGAAADLNWTVGSIANIVGAGVATTNTLTKSLGSFPIGGTATFTGQTISVSNGQVYGDTPFTGYRVGVNISRIKTGGALSGGSYDLNHSDDIVTITTYLKINGVPTQQETSDIHWAGSTNTNTQNYDLGFIVHKPFDEVRVTPKSRMVSATTQTASQTYQLDHVYLQRYTRQGGGAGFEATCNAQIPVTGFGLTSNFVITSPLALPPYFATGTMPEQEDTDPNTFSIIPTPSGFLNALSYYTVGVKDNVVVYPGGTFGGMRLTLATGFSADLANIVKVTLWRNVGGTRTEVANTQTVGLASATVINSDGSVTIGVVSPGDFDEITYELTTLVSLPGIDGIILQYPVVQRFCNTAINCSTPPVSTHLIRGVQNASSNYPVYAKAISPVSIGTLNAQIKDIDNVIDSDPNNYAVIEQLVGGLTDYGISVISQESGNYKAGTFAGFELQDVNIGSGSFAIRHIVKMYKDGAATGDEYDDGGNVANLKFLANTGRYLIGMKTTNDFDEIRISIQSIGSVGAYSTRVYGAVVEPFCKSNVQPACNVITPLNRSNFPVYIDGKQTGTDGNSVGTLNHYFENLSNIIDADGSNYAKLITTAGASTTASVAVQDGSKGIGNVGDASYELYPAGTFAGFDVSFPTVLGGGFFNNVTISLLGPDGAVVGTPQTVSGNLIGINSSVLSGGISRQTIGFMADVPFSGIKFSASKAVSVNWGEIRIYSAVIEKFCATPVIKCNEIEYISAPKYPLYINGKNTGVFTAFDGNSSINNSQNAIDDDVLNPDTYAALQLGVTAFSELGFSVGNGFGDFPKDTYIGFDIGTVDLLQANGFVGNRIELYKDGVLQQSSAGTQLAGGVSSDIITGGFQRLIIGTVAHQPFDEVRYVLNRVAGASLGEMRIYNVIARDFSPTSSTTCPLVLQCDGTYVLTDGPTTTDSPRIPAVIEFANTGYEGVLSAGYGIDDIWNAVSPDPTDFATIHFPASGITRGSISVAIPKVTLPAGTFAGFTVDKDNFPFSGGFLTNVKVTTYLDGQEQEHRNGASLIDFSFFGQWIGTPANIYTPGFQTILPFDEVQISIESGFSGLAQSLKVYSAYIRTVPSTTTTIPGGGTTTPIICINGACYKPAATGGTVLETKHGITALGRAGSDNDNWPMVRKGAWTVLESKEKGFVPNRIALTANLSSITNPIEGMMVYDEEADCLKIYTIKDGDTTAAWHCFITQACPD